MQPAAHRIGFHSDADQIVGAEHLQGLAAGEAHTFIIPDCEDWDAGFDTTTSVAYTGSMEVHIKPETESRLAELASKSGRATEDLVEDAIAGYLAEVAEVGEMLDRRYDDIKSGRVAPVDGEAFFDNLRQREDKLLGQRPPK